MSNGRKPYQERLTDQLIREMSFMRENIRAEYAAEMVVATSFFVQQVLDDFDLKADAQIFSRESFRNLLEDFAMELLDQQSDWLSRWAAKDEVQVDDPRLDEDARLRGEGASDEW